MSTSDEIRTDDIKNQIFIFSLDMDLARVVQLEVDCSELTRQTSKS